MNEDAEGHALRQTGWLAEQPDWLKDELLACARPRQFEPGEFAYHVHDQPGGMYGIASGAIGVVVPSGSEMIMCHVLGPGWWFGVGPILTRGESLMTFRAVEASTALHVSLADLTVISTRYPEVFRRIGALSEVSLQLIAARAVGDLLIPSVERRIAAVLARLASGQSGIAPSPLRLSQSTLGQMSNASRDRVNRTLQKFEKSGWLKLDYLSIRVLNASALERFSRGEMWGK